VTTQHLCGMGGDLFALVSMPGSPAPAVLNASGRAGSGASADRLRAEGFTAIPRTGHISAVPVPGCVDGWVALHTRFGSLPMSTLLSPARSYASDGFPISPLLAASAQRALAPLVAAGSDGVADYPTGPALRAGALMRRPGVARTLAAIASSGRAGFYEGEFGAGLLALGDGEYTADDLSSPLADWVDGLSLSIPSWGRTLWTVPPNSQGYLTLASAWIASGLPLPSDPSDPLWAHLLIEASRVAGYDRVAVLHEYADGAALVAPDRLAARRSWVSADGAAVGLGDGPYLGGGTIYLCTADGSGMGVSLIQSNYSGFGSMLIVPGVRIFLQNRGHGFSLVPGHPAEYGPGRRPPHTLSPALVTRTDDGSLDCVLGTMGGDSQPQVLLQLLARRYGVGRSPESPAAALAAGRWVLAGSETGYDVWAAGRGEVRVAVEGHAPSTWPPGLAGLGHDVFSSPAWSGNFGHAHMIAFEGGVLSGAADPRALGGSAAGL
jgi:gamma-glutamyltranspeptidase/glutathione hydrolase